MRGKPDAKLAARLREIKKISGISFHQLAGAIGVDKTTACRYANGSIHIPADRLPLIARAFGCDVRFLHMPPGSRPPALRSARRHVASPLRNQPPPLVLRLDGGFALSSFPCGAIRHAPMATEFDLLLTHALQGMAPQREAGL